MTGAGGDPSAALGSLYQEVILAHYRQPRNHGELEAPDVRVELRNPSCGDEIALALRMQEGRIVGVAFSGEGCAISQASASMMTVLLEGRTLEEAAALSASFHDLMHGRATPGATRELGDLRALAGVARFPVRVRCALLAWNGLQEAMRELEGKGKGDG